MPIISIIVPIYNAEKYIRRCINSILLQTFSDFELLLIDDGSIDKSGNICDEYAQKDNRIRVFHKENAGVASARQLGTEMAQGEYSIHVDADDWIEPTMLNEMYTCALKTNSDIVICDFYINENHSQKICKQWKTSTSILFLKAILEDKAMGSLWNKLIRHNLYKRIKFNLDINYCEDLLVLSQILYKPNINLSFLPKPFYHYYQNETSITHTRNKITYEIQFSFLRKLQRILELNNCDFVGIIKIRSMKILLAMTKSLLYTNRELTTTYQLITKKTIILGEYEKLYINLLLKYKFWSLICSFPALYKLLKTIKSKIKAH